MLTLLQVVRKQQQQLLLLKVKLRKKVGNHKLPRVARNPHKIHLLPLQTARSSSSRNSRLTRLPPGLRVPFFRFSFPLFNPRNLENPIEGRQQKELPQQEELHQQKEVQLSKEMHQQHQREQQQEPLCTHSRWFPLHFRVVLRLLQLQQREYLRQQHLQVVRCHFVEVDREVCLAWR